MLKVRKSGFLWAIPLLITIFSLSFPAYAKYSGGTGEPNDPYRIDTTEDLMLLGDSPDDYDMHFIMIADIDLDPNLPGRKVFDRAVIGTWFAPFTGVFDGNNHIISNLTIEGGGYLGLFGGLESEAVISNLGLETVDVSGMGDAVGGLAGHNFGNITNCYCTGTVKGNQAVGGLVGGNGKTWFRPRNGLAVVSYCYSTGKVIGNEYVGGLVGRNYDTISDCYSIAEVEGEVVIGGLVGRNGAWDYTWSGHAYGIISNSYSTGVVIGTDFIGGLVGFHKAGEITNSFWNIENGCLPNMCGNQDDDTTCDKSYGKTTIEMQTITTFLEAGWDFVDETENGTEDIWKIVEGLDYPRLWWEKKPVEKIFVRLSDVLEGEGTEDNPYLIYTAVGLSAVRTVPCAWNKHFKLMADIDLSGLNYYKAVIPEFSGSFDGNGFSISHLTIEVVNNFGEGGNNLGLFARLNSVAEVKNLGVVEVNIRTSDDYVGALVGENNGLVTNCYCTGMLYGRNFIGGLVGTNLGSISMSYSNCSVTGDEKIGGLVGDNARSTYGPYRYGNITTSYSTGAVKGDDFVGGLVGNNSGSIYNCYSMCMVSGSGWPIGGLIGNIGNNDVYFCYSTGLVSGGDYAGGLVGYDSSTLPWPDLLTDCFWDIQTSGRTWSIGGTNKTTTEMQTASTFLEAGWDFVGESENGTEDIWLIIEGQDYPRLWWELSSDPIDGSDGIDFWPGTSFIYKTNLGRYGTFIVEDLNKGWNNQLTIGWVTHNSDGTVYSSGSGLVIRGTWLVDLDEGVELASDDEAVVDWHWRQHTSTTRSLSPWNNAKFKLIYRGSLKPSIP